MTMLITADTVEPGDVVLTSEREVLIYRDSTLPDSAGTPLWFTPGVVEAQPAPTGELSLLVRANEQVCCTPDGHLPAAAPATAAAEAPEAETTPGETAEHQPEYADPATAAAAEQPPESQG